MTTLFKTGDLIDVTYAYKIIFRPQTKFQFLFEIVDIHFNIYNPIEKKNCSGKSDIELLNNTSHGLSPPGGLVSPSGGVASLLCDQGLHFASIKLCQVS